MSLERIDSTQRWWILLLCSSAPMLLAACSDDGTEEQYDDFINIAGSGGGTAAVGGSIAAGGGGTAAVGGSTAAGGSGVAGTSIVTAQCGNDVVEDGEDCENAVAITETCTSMGRGTGTLACDQTCHYDYSGCVQGVVDSGILDSGAIEGGAIEGGAIDSGNDASQGDAGPIDFGDSFCLENDSIDFTADGPFDVDTTRSGSVNIYAPQNIPAGCKVPIIHFANGTGANCGMYTDINERLASHGFLVGCYESTSTGSGEGCMTALETLYAEYPDIAADKIGSTGHSQGGGCAITCVYLAEQEWADQKIYTAHAIEPAHGMSRSSYTSEYPLIESPVFIMSGSDDGIVSDEWVTEGYEILTTETHWYEAVGASHLSNTRWSQESAVAWFRWKLLGDPKAEEYVLNTMPNSSDWRVVEVKNYP